MSFVRTVLGDIEPAALGVTYAHEHVILDAPIVEDRFPHILLDDVDVAIEELGNCAQVGVGAMIDAMPCGIGRDPVRLAAISEATGVHLVATTGLHTRKWYPGLSWANELPPDKLAELFVADIEDGIDRFDYRGPHVERTPHRAGVLKIATLQEEPNDRDHRAFAAAAITHRATGVPILTHCEEGRGGLEQVELLDQLGVDPGVVVLSHTDKVDDPGYHLALAATGVYLEYDQALRHPIDEHSTTVRMAAAVVEAGFGDQVMLGTDGARRSMWSGYGGKPGLAALARDLVPAMGRAGVSVDAISRILVDNPARFFTFAEVAQ
ncbi:MAG: aryldialkylphosphatase [Acidimicrobiia bacterium]|nr:aryldialkylphosphatase [Acidimicrobiia bacterium]